MGASSPPRIGNLKREELAPMGRSYRNGSTDDLHRSALDERRALVQFALAAARVVF